VISLTFMVYLAKNHLHLGLEYGFTLITHGKEGMKDEG